MVNYFRKAIMIDPSSAMDIRNDSRIREHLPRILEGMNHNG